MKDSTDFLRILRMRQPPHFLYREQSENRNAFPENIRDRVGDPALACAVTRAVERSGECAPFQPALGVLVYSYAAGIYTSAEIARLMSKATGFWEDEATLRRYRRHHLARIKDCLAEVLSTMLENVQESDYQREAEDRVLRAIREDACALDF